MALTRIKTNQITDSAVTTAKIANNAVTAGKLADNLTYGSDLTVSGNLTVSGTTTAVSTTNTRVSDSFITLSEGTSGSPSNDSGLMIDRGSSDNQAIMWDESADEFVFANVGAETGDTAGNVTISSYADLQMAGLTATTGDFSGAVGVDGDFDVATNKFTVAAATGNTLVAGTLDATGLASLDGGIDVDGAFTVADTTGNVATTGTLDVTGTTTAAAVNLSGLLSADGGIDVDGAFTVADTTGNVSTSGTLGVTGTSTLGVINASGLASLNAGIAVDGAFTVADTTGNVSTSGTLDVTSTSTLGVINASGLASLDAGIDVDGAFTVADTTGNVSTSGTLGVTGTSTLGVINASGLASLDGGIDVDGAFTVANGNGNIGTTGTLNVDGATTLNGAVTLGDASGDAITVTGTATFGASADFDSGFTVAAAQTIDVGSNKITNVADPVSNQDAATKAYVDSSVSNASAFDIAGDSGTDTVTVGSDTLTFAGTANEITTAVTDNTITIGLPDDVTIAGNLTVSGTTTTVNSTTTELEDPVMRLGVTGLGADAGKDRGIEFLYYDGSEQTGFFGWDNSADAFVFLTGATNSSEVFSGTAGAATFGAITGTTITSTGTATLNDAAIGGGYGSTGVTISAAGVIQANGAITSDGAVTGGSLTDGTATLSSGALSGATTGAFGSNVTVGGTLGVTGESTLASATVSDLTDNRIVIAGTSGALEDSANLTFDGTTFEVGGGYGATGLDIAMDGNISTNGTLTVDGTSTLGVVNVSGLASLDGGIDVDGAFTVADSTGNVSTTGTLTAGNTDVGTLDASGLASLDGGIDVDGAFTVANTTGNVVTTGTLQAGETTLSSATVSDLTSGRVVLAGTSGAIEDSGNLTFNGSTLAVTGAATISTTLAVTGAITASSNVDIADAGSLRVGTGNDFTINHDGTDTTITNGTGILAIDGAATSAIRVNEAGADVDFVVEGDTNTALLVVDAGNENVGIGGAPNANAILHVNDSGAMIIPVGTTSNRPTGVTGMLRYNSTVGGIEYYDADSWESISTAFTIASSQTFSGDDTTTDFTLSALSGADSYTVAGVFVTLNGIVQEPTTVYGITGNTLSFTTAPATGDLIEVRKFTTTTTINTLADVDGDTQIQVEESSDEDVIRFDTAGVERVTINASGLNIVSGTMNGTATSAQYADLAEMYAADAEIEPGTVVHFAGDGKVAACDQDACRSVAGIISTDPAHLMNSVQEGVALALAGRVPCKVTGPVAAGDLMVSAGNGMARAEANPSIGTVIGKAIEANEDGEGVIEVLALMM